MSAMSLSAAERRFIAAGVAHGVRGDGRAVHGLRRLRVETGELPQAHGSARASLGMGETEVLVAVRAELSACDDAAPDEGVIECAAQVWAAASGTYAGSRAAAEENSEVAALLQRLLAAPGAVDRKGLCVQPGRWCWRVYVDAMVLAANGGVADVASAAAYAALRTARLPRVRAVVPPEGGDAELELDADPGALWPLPVAPEHTPVAVTLHQVAGRFIADATRDEEACADSYVTAGVNGAGKLVFMSSGGAAGVAPPALHEALAAARVIGPAVIKAVEGCLSGQAGGT